MVKIQLITNDGTSYAECDVDKMLALAALTELLSSNVELARVVIMSVDDADHGPLKNMLIEAMRREPTAGSFTGFDVDEHEHEECMSSCYCRLCISCYCRLYMLYLD